MGAHLQRIDEGGRLAIPIKFRRGQQDFVVTQSPEDCLCIYPAESFERFVAAVASVDDSDSGRRDYLRGFVAVSAPVTLDRQGRLGLTPNHRRYAHLRPSSDCYVIGLDDRMEVWEYRRWEAYQSGAAAVFGELDDQPADEDEWVEVEILDASGRAFRVRAPSELALAAASSRDPFRVVVRAASGVQRGHHD